MPEPPLPTRQPARSVLTGVRRVHFHDSGPRCPEDVPFPSCLCAVLEYLDDGLGCEHFEAHGTTWTLGCTYAFTMATSGAAFYLSWKPGWHQDNVDIIYSTPDPDEAYRRAFRAAGYAYRILPNTGPDSEGPFRAEIKESIAGRAMPVLAFGVIGPPECCLVTGYDADGEVLVGWNYFQDAPEFAAGVEYEPTGEFRKRNWFPQTGALMVVGERGERPTLSETLRETMRHAIRLARTPSMYDPAFHGTTEAFVDRRNGLAAYDAWAEAITDDAEFPGNDGAALRARTEVHNSAVGAVAEGRWYASEHLKQMAPREPAIATDLLAAADCYRAEHDLMWRIWDLTGFERGDGQARTFSDSGVRRKVAAIIREARDQDARAACHLEDALRKMDAA